MIKLKKLFKRSWRLRALVCYLSFAIAVITGLPGRASAGVAPTESSLKIAVGQQFDREADMELIHAAFSGENGHRAFKYVGISMEQFDGYLSKLPDGQVNLLAEKLRAEMPAGGGASGIFWTFATLLLILFIVFLILDITDVYKLPFRRK